MGLLIPSPSTPILDKNAIHELTVKRIRHILMGILLASPFFTVGFLFMTPYVQSILSLHIAPIVNDRVVFSLILLSGGLTVWLLSDALFAAHKAQTTDTTELRIMLFKGVKWEVLLSKPANGHLMPRFFCAPP